MLKLILKTYKSKITWKNIGRFFRFENWVLPLYFLILTPSTSEGFGRYLLLGVGVPVSLLYIFNCMVGNELPMIMYFSPITDSEKKSYFRKAFVVRVGMLLGIYLILMSVLLHYRLVAGSQMLDGIIFLVISGIPSMLHVGNGLDKKGLENFYGCDLSGSLLMVFGYFVLLILRLEFAMKDGELTALANTTFGWVVKILMLGLVAWYVYHFYPKVEAYVLDYERVRNVNLQKEQLYQGKKK